MIDPRHLLIVPRPEGVLLSINGEHVMKLLDAEQLMIYGKRFVEAAAERLRQDKAR